MSRNKVLYLLYGSVSILCILSVTLCYLLTVNDIEVVSDASYGSNVIGVSVYEPLEYPNEMKCNLTTVNNIIVNMVEQDFYKVEQDSSTGDIIDVVLSNDEGDIYRILYNRRTRDYVCFSNQFIKNYIPGTYINK